MPAFALPDGPQTVTRSASPRTERSPTTEISVRRFGTVLSPVNCRRMSTRLVSYYALFK